MVPLSLLPRQEGTCWIPAGEVGLWRNWPVLKVRPLNLEGHCVSEPWLNSNGVIPVRPAVALPVYFLTGTVLPTPLQYLRSECDLVTVHFKPIFSV